MCYMARKNRQIGVREIRQNLSVYLDRVKAGETLHVTEYGRVVAILAPLPAERLSTLDRLVLEGRAIPPKGSIKDRRPPRPAPPGTPPSEVILNELREDVV
jgi:antitoxin (DNA-binding transcriptional repressor) of toxin-antitoxin stability system